MLYIALILTRTCLSNRVGSLCWNASSNKTGRTFQEPFRISNRTKHIGTLLEMLGKVKAQGMLQRMETLVQFGKSFQKWKPYRLHETFLLKRGYYITKIFFAEANASSQATATRCNQGIEGRQDGTLLLTCPEQPQ